MDQNIIFDGQQTDERILFTVEPHRLTKLLGIAKILFLSLFIIIITLLISQTTKIGIIGISGVIGGVLVFVFGIWLTNSFYQKSKSYITDRRIFRFDPVSPFVTTKRALFWNEALKAKAYNTNLLMRMFNIGTVSVEPHLAEHENVVITQSIFNHGTNRIVNSGTLAGFIYLQIHYHNSNY